MDKSKVNKALTADESPTPGYLYNEIAKMTHTSIEDTEKLVTLLLAKLTKNDCNVKYKVLMVIKHVARLGRSEFKRIMQGHVGTLKTCLQFRGPAHPLKGDAPNKRVRDTAEEAIKAIFDTESAAATSSAMASRMTGIGSAGGSTSAAAGHSGPRSPAPGPPYGARSPAPGDHTLLHQRPVSTGTMAGIGNYTPKGETGGGVMNKLTTMFKKATSASDKPVDGPSGVPGFNYASNRGTGAYGSSAAYSGPSLGGTSPARGGGSSPANASGRWGGGSAPQRQAGTVGGGWGRPAAGRGNTTAVAAGGGATDGEYERGLVADVTAPGGVRPVPDAGKLQAFLAAARTLDPPRLASLLDERLAGDSWQVATKALLVVQALCSADGCEQHRAFLADHCDEVLALHDDASRDSLRKLAKGTLEVLGVDYSAGGGTAAAGGDEGGDLLGMEPAAAAAPAPAAGGEGDIFGGMSFGAPAPAEGGGAPGFSFTAAAPAPAPAPSSASIDLAGLYDTTAPATAAPTPAAKGEPASAEFDFGSGATSAPAPAQAAAGFNFGAPAPAPAPAAAGFNFGAPAPAPAPAAAGFNFGAPAPAPAPAAAGFNFGAPAPAPAVALPAPSGSTLGSGAKAGGGGQQPPKESKPADPFAGLMDM